MPVGDWLDALLAREVEREWEDKPIVITIEEEKRPTRYWQRDEQGLRAIKRGDVKRWHASITSRIYPFVQMNFRIYSKRQRVFICKCWANTAAIGRTYKIVGEDEIAHLEVDKEGTSLIA